MKLSEMGAREGAAALCALAPHLEAIAGDEALREALVEAAKSKESNVLIISYAQVALALVPALCGRHYDHVIAVARILSGKSESELDALGVMGLAGELYACLDSEVLRFFKLSGALAAGK
jgi:hypothetical protein